MHTVKIEVYDEDNDTEVSLTAEVDDEAWDPEHRHPCSYLAWVADDAPAVAPSLRMIEADSIEHPDRWTIRGFVDDVLVVVQGGNRFRSYLDHVVSDEPVGRIRIRPLGASDKWTLSFGWGDRTSNPRTLARRPGARVQDAMAAAIPLVTESGHRIVWTYVLSTPGSPLKQEADGLLYRLEVA